MRRLNQLKHTHTHHTAAREGNLNIPDGNVKDRSLFPSAGFSAGLPQLKPNVCDAAAAEPDSVLAADEMGVSFTPPKGAASEAGFGAKVKAGSAAGA